MRQGSEIRGQIPVPRGKPRDGRAHPENRAHRGQRERDGNVDPAGGEHLEGDKGQQSSQPVMQEAEAVEQRGQREVERAQAEDGQDV